MDTLNTNYRKILIMYKNNSLSHRHSRLCGIGDREVRRLYGCPFVQVTRVFELVSNYHLT